MATTPTRIYVVSARHDGHVIARRLVRAPTQAQAIRHVATEAITAEVASQDDLVELVAAGAKVETSGTAPAAEGDDPDAANPNPGQEGPQQ